MFILVIFISIFTGNMSVGGLAEAVHVTGNLRPRSSSTFLNWTASGVYQSQGQSWRSREAQTATTRSFQGHSRITRRHRDELNSSTRLLSGHSDKKKENSSFCIHVNALNLFAYCLQYHHCHCHSRLSELNKWNMTVVLLSFLRHHWSRALGYILNHGEYIH